MLKKLKIAAAIAGSAGLLAFALPALAALTFGALTQTSDGNLTVDIAAGSAYSLGPSITTGSITIGSTGLTTGGTTVYGGTASTSIQLIPATNGGVFVGAGAGTGDIIVASSSAANLVAIANGTGASVVRIANVQAAGSVSIGAGMTTGTIQIGGGQTSGSILIGGGVQTGNIYLGGGTGVQSVDVGGGTGVKTVSIATGTSANVIRIGTGQTGGSISIGTAMTTGTITLGNGNATTSVAGALAVTGTTTLLGVLTAERASGTVVSNAVTLNTISGRISDDTDLTASSTRAAITLNNSRILAESLILINVCSTPNTGAMIGVSASSTQGSATITVWNASVVQTSTWSLCFLVIN